MGSLGNECDRALWYSFRWCSPIEFNAETLKRFDDGNMGEDLMARRLRLVEGITLMTEDPETGRQWRIEHFGGHLSGYMDGAILGLIQAPKTWHVWEGKQTEEKRFNELEKIKRELGEKSALSSWNFTYYVQGQMYMRYQSLERHYLTCSTPGGRKTTSVRTDYDPVEAERQERRAGRIIFSQFPPAGISDKPDFYKCRWCDHAAICHKQEGAETRRNCRTCLHVTPHADGSWHCAKHDETLDYTQQQAGCSEHRFIPDLVQGEQIDADPETGTVTYLMSNGETWMDQGAGS
jgi:hypothetical protein